MTTDADRAAIVQYDAEVQAEARRLIESGTPPIAAFWQAPVNVCERRRGNVIQFPRHRVRTKVNEE